MSRNHDAVSAAAERERFLRRIEWVEALLAEVRALRGQVMCDGCGILIAEEDAEAEVWRWYVQGDELVPLCGECTP
jgi:hypothetical protein